MIAHVILSYAAVEVEVDSGMCQYVLHVDHSLRSEVVWHRWLCYCFD